MIDSTVGHGVDREALHRLTEPQPATTQGEE